MLYGAAQSGPLTPPGLNVTVICPGDQIVLFDGTETPLLALTSVAFLRGPSRSMSDAGVTFYAYGMPVGTTIDIQGSNTDVDGDYLTLATLARDANGNAAYTDVGRAAYYRAKYSAYTSGAMAVVKAQR